MSPLSKPKTLDTGPRQDAPVATATDSAGGADAVLEAGALVLDAEHRCVHVDNATITLAPIELNLLRCLLDAKGRVASRQQLFETISSPGRKRQPKLQSVDVHIKRLRQKLGDVGRAIITVRNVGYRFEICRQWIDQ